MKNYLSVFIMVLLLSACAKPLPENKRDYVGEWRSPEMSLLILADGTVAYKRFKNGASISVNGPLKEFIGDDFVVGILFMSTTFDVSEAPHEIDGVWKMTIDGVELSKVEYK